MQFIENTEFELPVVITRGFVLFPNDSGQLTVNREFTKKLLLIKEKFYSELQKRNNLDEKKNHINIKSNIHVNVRDKINSDLYFNMKNIKYYIKYFMSIKIVLNIKL